MNPTSQGQVQPYTSPNGQTVPGAQVDQNNSIMARLASNQTMTPQQLQGVSNQASQASAGLAAIQTAPARQSYINNGDIPAIQNNYDQLAKQLYDIDKAISSSGQYNGTPPPDAISSPGVAASPLALTNSILSGNTFSSPNPAIGLQSKLVSNDNIIGLLSTLNDSLAKEFSSRKNTYASNVKGHQSVLDQINNILDKNSTVGMHNADLAEKYYSDNITNNANLARLSMDPTYQLRQIITELDSKKGLDKKVSPQDYNEAKQKAAKLGISGATFDSATDAYRNPSNPYYGLTLSGAQEQAQQTSEKSGTNALQSVDSLMNSWRQMGSEEKFLAKIPGIVGNIPALTPNASAIQADFLNNIIGPLRQSVVGGRVTQQEITWLNNQLPGPGDDETTAQNKVNAMKRNIASKLQDPNYNIGADSSQKSPSAGPAPTKIGRFNVTVH